MNNTARQQVRTEQSEAFKRHQVKPATKIETIAISSDFVGSISLRGMYGGAICWYYRCVSIDGKMATHELVEPKRVTNPDGTFSTRYEAVQ